MLATNPAWQRVQTLLRGSGQGAEVAGVTWRVLVLRTLLCLSLDALTRLGPNEFGHSGTFLECSGRAWELVWMLAHASGPKPVIARAR
jgi:hypothetical protein